MGELSASLSAPEKELTLDELIEFFGRTFGEEFLNLVWEKGNKGEFSQFLSIVINGRSYQHDNFLETILKIHTLNSRNHLLFAF